MNQVNNHLKEFTSRIEQRKNLRKAKERREREAKRKLDARRNFLIGELVCKYFPSMMQYQPQRSQADNRAEFADFESKLRWLSEHTEILQRMQEDAQSRE